jgi:hypothetical protein
MQDYIVLQPRREPIALGRTFFVLGLMAALFTGGIVALS